MIFSRAFELSLGRSPHREELRGHCTRIGEDLESVVSSYLKSLEFARRNLLVRDYMGSLDLVEIEGFKIYASAEDLSVGKAIQRAQYALDVTAVFRKFVKPGMNVNDIGANIGYFTMLSPSIVGTEGTVVSIEPNHGNLKLIEASRRANKFTNVTIAQVAAGRELGILVLNRSHSNGTTSDLDENINSIFESETVPSVPVDNLISTSKPIHFIKIDVEGEEYNALMGCREIIKTGRPIIVSEFSPDLMPGISHVDGSFYLNWLCSLGYRLGVVESHGGSVTNYESDIDAIMDVHRSREIDHLDVLATPRKKRDTKRRGIYGMRLGSDDVA